MGANTPVLPDSPFGEATIHKTLIEVAILRLSDESRIGLDHQAFGDWTGLQPPSAQMVDLPIADITMRELLIHTGGWVRTKAGDPVANGLQISVNKGGPLPGSADWFFK